MRKSIENNLKQILRWGKCGKNKINKFTIYLFIIIFKIYNYHHVPLSTVQQQQFFFGNFKFSFAKFKQKKYLFLVKFLFQSFISYTTANNIFLFKI